LKSTSESETHIGRAKIMSDGLEHVLLPLENEDIFLCLHKKEEEKKKCPILAPAEVRTGPVEMPPPQPPQSHAFSPPSQGLHAT
jgi:hypothetical protein